MRVLVCSWRDIRNPRAGGAEVITFEHMRRWVNAGHQVTLFTAAYSGAPCEEELEGVRVVRRGGPHTVHLAAQHWYRRLRARPDLAVDEIHGVPFCLRAYAGVPVVAWTYEVAHDIWYRMYPPALAIAGRVAETATLRWYALCRVPFITDSHSTAEDLTSLGVAANRVTVIEPAIHRPAVLPTPKKAADPTLIFVGRLVRMKGVEDAIRALSQVRRQFPHCRLWILGSGTPAYENQLRSLAGQLHVSEAVQFKGWIDGHQKYDLLGQAHLLIHPSSREGWGMNVIEANTMGTPAVGYCVSGLRDSIVPGKTGLLSPYGEPDRLAAAVISLLRDEARYHEMQQAAISWSRRFSWDVGAERSLEVLLRTHRAGSQPPAERSQKARAPGRPRAIG